MQAQIKALEEQLQLQQEEHEKAMLLLQKKHAAEMLALDDDDVLASDTDSQPVGQPVTGDGGTDRNDADDAEQDGGAGTDEEPTLREMDEAQFAEWLQGPDPLDDLESCASSD